MKRAAFKGYVEQVWGWDEEEQLRLHETRFVAQNYRVIAADSKDVGFIAVARASDCLNLNQLFILPDHQGQGIGDACMAIVFEEAESLGLLVKLRVLKVNPRALAFYRRLGFEVVGETDTHDLLEFKLQPSPNK